MQAGYPVGARPVGSSRLIAAAASAFTDVGISGGDFAFSGSFDATSIRDVSISGGAMAFAGSWTITAVRNVTVSGGAVSFVGAFNLALRRDAAIAGGAMAFAGTWTIAGGIVALSNRRLVASGLTANRTTVAQTTSRMTVAAADNRRSSALPAIVASRGVARNYTAGAQL